MIAAQPATLLSHNLAFPAEGFAQLRKEGLLLAPFTQRWGIASGTHGTLLETMRRVGGLDLSLGRLYEGHVNAAMLIARYGDLKSAAEDVRQGHLFGVWNTDAPEGVKGRRDSNRLFLHGRKAFASGAGSLTRPIVTVDIEGEGRTMCVLPMETLHADVDWSSWEPLGMQGSDSFTVDFTGVSIASSVILGGPGDYYSQPWFSGGAIRFAAVQLGAAERLAASFVQWLAATNRTGDPYQQSRAGEVEMAVETGTLWIRHAAHVAEDCFQSTEQPAKSKMIHCANLTRLVVERICLDVMELVTRGVGARGLLGPAAFEKQIRDLTMYLRQPAPDQALAEVGRQALSCA